MLPINVLFFYQFLGKPVYTPSRLSGKNVDGLLATWPRGGGLEIDVATWAMNVTDGEAFEPPLYITGKECYAYNSGEFRILGRLQFEEIPKQAYCETTIGTMMVDWRKESTDRAWQHEEDTWDEAYEFGIRLFAALAGVMADSAAGSQYTFWFLRDMTDVFDIYFLTYADVEQMHEGRPLLAGNHDIAGYEQSYHNWVAFWLAVGFVILFLRALADIGFEPFIWMFRRCGCKAEHLALRRTFDALFSLFLIEIPFLCLRWVAWTQYGLPVSVMAVKNVFGIYEDLYALGILRGFNAGDKGPRGIQLLFRQK
jgi:hypothetical protein